MVLWKPLEIGFKEKFAKWKWKFSSAFIYNAVAMKFIIKRGISKQKQQQRWQQQKQQETENIKIQWSIDEK